MLGAHSRMIWCVNRVDANVADQDSHRAGLQRRCDCGGRPVGFDTMDSGDVGQPATVGCAFRVSARPTDLCTLASV